MSDEIDDTEVLDDDFLTADIHDEVCEDCGELYDDCICGECEEDDVNSGDFDYMNRE